MAKLNKYEVGIFKSVQCDGYTEYYKSCTCGHREVVGKNLDYHGRVEARNKKCSNCLNTRFIHIERDKQRINIPYLKARDVTRRGFRIQRVNLSVFADKNGDVKWKENMIRVIWFDIFTKQLHVFKNGQRVSNWNREEELMRFFINLDSIEVKDMVSTPETQALYNFIWRRLSKKRNSAWNTENRFYVGLLRFVQEDYRYLEILSSAGYPDVERFFATYNRWTSYEAIDREATKPKDILKLPKFMLPYFRQDETLGLYNLEQVQKALTKVDGNRFRELVEIIKDESDIGVLCQTLDRLIEIHDTYKYNNLKKLTLYLFREIRMHQGIDSPSSGATLLRDYIRMCEKLGLEYEKYPKSLKKEHDIVQMNYRVQMDEKKKAEFKEAVDTEDYKFLEYSKGTYAIVSPSEMDDLIREGNELSHCVASYVTDIVSDKCKILFLRKTAHLNSPLGTVEIRGGNIRQARGFANRGLTRTEMNFIRDWAEKKELRVNCY
ncbi:PcfJ-like protein [Bacillus phage vB_BanS_Skywalker]|uniref:PcfJ-like protein n=2 Tax=Tsamsavirus TaxID=3044849 RepID=A0AAE8YVG9_9CAUD|nr:PcfJ-like protein [Bacillus phage vB_BanS_Skywalker]YP_010681014.1 PcfJ-like protein [Bacillus phage vB_BanS_MrDarsey]UGO47950.1 PcfJ-like protein [Bacillus phage vB_BanS_MrDarsey]UGO51307.1 PcfJ-like protein [Bacillus phage vB_BanS_Skywalker]